MKLTCFKIHIMAQMKTGSNQIISAILSSRIGKHFAVYFTLYTILESKTKLQASITVNLSRGSNAFNAICIIKELF